ncbi:Predicted O-linked N-acetylglucosamine transferase, SPINDLY family [Delftia tsuruhatensis]|uniref:tetratricopeptide repeat protein n=1 Tax=Delftia tsuruhatensis TaxID=180282 RepID=UPI001E720906|nr:tetratricopeptide repeat protein [Delftia tsuruhatensis]CAB5664462.1 Predicted O-linked N-acetylglucosamine transferase, SPINDLY family [Delftia tsuruhatensis]CAC9677424.1 Predicted O-linked N-acetylglucosamine transferase, SPINDLY family [Delftia tsuruhatensis]
MATSSKAIYGFSTLLLLAVLAVYLPGLSNGLLFDDMRLTDGTIFGSYGSLLQFKQRTLSYGSFVWIEQIFGAGWWKQRAFNVALHLATVAALYALFKALLTHTRFPHDMEEQPHFPASRDAALHLGLVLFALNPVAVYAVGYLIQRSIVMATLFAVLACWSFVRGLQSGRIAWHAAALVCYLLAVLSKEHAFLTVAMVVPLYLFIRRPGLKPALAIIGATLLLLAIASAAVFHFFGQLVGQIFDEQSLGYARQLEALHPGITSRIYPLSILNEAALFFAYGFLWAVPYVGWMSVDLRPAFPLGLGSVWHLAGALGYLALLACSVWALLKRPGVMGLVALCLLFPLLWYATEFATVWLQDPFVLYRSYLWAIAIPGLVAIALTGVKPRTIYIAGIFIGIVFGALAFERVLSLQDAGTSWADAAEKIDKKAPANAVGRGRAFLNLGTAHADKGMLDQALQDFATANALGDLGGNALFNMGAILSQQRKFTEALNAFDAAQSKGFKGQALHYQKAEAMMAMGQLRPAFDAYSLALNEPSEDSDNARQMEQAIRLKRAEAAIGLQQYAIAADDFRRLLQASPNAHRPTVGLGLALVGQGDSAQAKQLLDALIARSPSAPAYYGRAMAHRGLGHLPEALKDLDQAIRLEPQNPQYRQIRNQLSPVPAAK